MSPAFFAGFLRLEKNRTYGERSIFTHNMHLLAKINVLRKCYKEKNLNWDNAIWWDQQNNWSVYVEKGSRFKWAKQQSVTASFSLSCVD